MLREFTLVDSEEILPILGKNIEKARLSKSYNLQELGIKVGYDRELISRLENGEQRIRFRNLVKIAKVLGVSLPKLFTRDFSVTDKYEEKNYLFIYSKNLNRTVKSKGIKLSDLKNLTGINESNISELANLHKRKSPDYPNPLVTTLYALAKATNSDLSTWLD